MLQKLAYRYHRFLGIMFMTVLGTGLMKIDFSKTQINKSKTSSMLLKEDELSLLKKANAWLNSPPLSASDLKGKVVLIEFGTYTCINWIRTLPYVRAWAEKYKEKGLAVIVPVAKVAPGAASSALPYTLVKEFPPFVETYTINESL